MKKLRKEDIQKIGLGLLMALGIIYGYFDLLLGPVKARQKSIVTSISALDPEIATAKAQLARAVQVENDAPKAEATIATINAMIPEGAPVAWFPVLIGDFFKKFGFEKGLTRMNNELVDKELPGYRRVSWGIDLPRVDCLTFAAAVAELENEEPLVEIQALTIETLREDPEAQRVLLTVNNIVKQ